MTDDRIAQVAQATEDQAAVIREAFRQFFPGGGPELPDPIPDHGSVSDNDWFVRYALNADENGDPRLDFFARNPLTEPLFGQVSHDGTVETLDSYVEHYSYDPAVPGDESAAERRMRDYNEEVGRRLKMRRLA